MKVIHKSHPWKSSMTVHFSQIATVSHFWLVFIAGVLVYLVVVEVNTSCCSTSCCWSSKSCCCSSTSCSHSSTSCSYSCASASFDWVSFMTFFTRACCKAIVTSALSKLSTWIWDALVKGGWSYNFRSTQCWNWGQSLLYPRQNLKHDGYRIKIDYRID